MFNDSFFYNEGVIDAQDDIEHNRIKKEYLSKKEHDAYLRGYYDAVFGIIKEQTRKEINFEKISG